MTKSKHLVTLFLAAIALAACAPQPAPQATSTLPAETSLPAATAFVPVEKPTEFVDYCLDCHSNQEQLVALAKPEVKVESESKGVG